MLGIEYTPSNISYTPALTADQSYERKRRLPRNADCKLCPLHQNSKHVCVWGVGPEPCEVMIVGMNPGYNEDKVGIPFVGRAGKELDSLLSGSSLERSKIYVTNSVKCRTQDNAEPAPAEVNACRIYLKEEIENVRPKIIVALGNTALRALTARSGVTNLRGTVLALRHEFNSDCSVVATFHPSAVVRFEKYRRSVIEDFRRVESLLSGKTTDVPVRWGYYSHDDGPSFDVHVWSFDTETTGLDPNAEDFRFRMLGIDDGRKVSIFPTADIPAGVRLLRRALSNGIRVVGHNSQFFDRHVLQRVYGEDLQEVDDTLLMHYCLQEDGRHNLELLATSYLRVAPWKGDAFSEDVEKLAAYCARDCRYTLRLFSLFTSQGGDNRVYSSLLKPAARTLRTLQDRGVYISQENLVEAEEEINAKSSALLKEIKRVAQQENYKDFNPNAPKQVAALLYGKLGLPVPKYTPKGQPSTDEESLKTLRGKHEIADLMLDHRKARKLLDAFVRPYAALRDSHGRVHPEYSLTYTVTGRTSSRGPNIQQLPRDPRIRRIVSAPAGKVLVIADLSQIELRLAAWLAPEQAMLTALRNGDDLHRLMAAEIFGKPPSEVTSEERTE